jgi:hypothetical protein
MTERLADRAEIVSAGYAVRSVPCPFALWPVVLPFSERPRYEREGACSSASTLGAGTRWIGPLSSTIAGSGDGDGSVIFRIVSRMAVTTIWER